VSTVPSVDISQQKRKIRDRIYSAYFTTTRAHAPGLMDQRKLVKQLRRRFGRYLPPDRSASVLDIGCGSGEFVLFLQEAGYEAAVGIDVSPEQVAIAHSRGAVNVHSGDIFSYLSNRADEYSLITAFNILEHLEREELFQLMDLIVQTLRPGGRFIAMVPNAKGLFGSHVRYADLTHELSFTPLSVHQLCGVVGLRVINVFENGPVPHGIPSALRWLVWQCIRGVLWIARMAEGADWTWPVFTQDLLFVAEKAPDTPGAMT
jgi:SAM-dependent methyltransferase